MYNRLLAAIVRLEHNATYAAIQRGFIWSMPIVMTGSLALLISNFPIEQMQLFLSTWADGLLRQVLTMINDCTLGFLSGYLVISITYHYAAVLDQGRLSLRLVAIFCSFSCFLASFGGWNGSLDVSSFGTTGIFSALFCSVVGTQLFFRLRGLVTRSGSRSTFYAGDAMRTALPLLLSVSIFILLYLILSRGFGLSGLNDLLLSPIFQLFARIHNELANGVIFTIMVNALWLLGIHGGNALDSVAQTAFSLDDGGVISKSFLDNFVMIGGSGATVCLLLALLIASRDTQNRRLSHMSMPMVLFNVNELLVFGLPIVLNPVMIIPFILVPLVSLLLSYSAVILGWMPVVETAVNWTTPPLFSGYLSTQSIRGVLVQIVTIAVGTLLYIPFVRLSEQLRRQRSQFMLHELTQQFHQKQETHSPFSLLGRPGSAGEIADTLARQLESDVRRGRVPVFYQPQVNEARQVAGAEALLRWQFLGQPVYPPLAIALAAEAGCFEQLTFRIAEQVLEDIPSFCRAAGQDANISLNISPDQLDNAAFLKKLIQMAEEAGVAGSLVLEVTEETSLNRFSHIGENIELLHQHHIRMAIDDFSMGQTSLEYLRSNRFDYVKLDRSIVSQILQNNRCLDIVRSIVDLGDTLHFEVIAEYVEEEALREALSSVGCRLYQGYLYSPAVPLPELKSYVRQLPARADSPSAHGNGTI